MNTLKLPAWMAVFTAGLAVLAVAAIGSTITDLGPWYQSLNQPSWKPADQLFGPAWTLIFALAALSAVLGWRSMPAGPRRDWMISLFVLNGALNLLWSLLFFRFHRPDWALVEVSLLWLSIVWLMVLLARHSKLASLLLAPYLIWVGFAAVLNYAVVQLNAPF